MIRYTVHCSNPHRHFIGFDAVIPCEGNDTVLLQLASWRPGRYELGFFAKNIRSWKVTDAHGKPLPFTKATRDLWKVETMGSREIFLSYEYYASELNAGSSYLDEEQLYINPVNCFFYVAGQDQWPYEIEFRLPEAYEIATGLTKKGPHVLLASSYDELADSPLIASATLKHLHYNVDGVIYRIWIQGEHRMDEELLLRQFTSFTELQVRMFGGIPCSEYHFLFQFLPYFVRHGVEHHNSTVIAMGPVADFMNQNWYNEFLGISSHELYHTWNIKSIRPVEMMPYDFTRENYTRLGYVAEGVTTYYGDLVLARSGVFSFPQMEQIISEAIQDHEDNHGRLNHSVADSSLDTWLDGYGPGIPWRKVSIYNEGCLIAMMADIHIIHHSGATRSMDDAMRMMYERYGKTGSGYSEDDYWAVLREVGGDGIMSLFTDLVNKPADYLKQVEYYLSLIGYSVLRTPASRWSDSRLGVTIDESSARMAVASVVPGSPADRAGLWKDDEILYVNGVAPYKNIQNLLKLNSGREMKLGLMRKHRRREVIIAEDGETWAWKYQVVPVMTRTSEQERNWNYWSGSRGTAQN